MGDQAVYAHFATRAKCLMCKRRFAAPFLIPAGCDEEGCLAINPDLLFHMRDTHGLPEDVYRGWLIDAVNGLDLDTTQVPRKDLANNQRERR